MNVNNVIFIKKTQITPFGFFVRFYVMLIYVLLPLTLFKVSIQYGRQPWGILLFRLHVLVKFFITNEAYLFCTKKTVYLFIRLLVDRNARDN